MKIKDAIPAIHKEGYVTIIIAIVATVILMSLSKPIGTIALFITLFIVCFFRDPNRVAPKKDNLVLSPADGTIDKIEEAIAPPELKLGNKTFKRVSLFLSVFNVHVNRVPVSGKITKLHYRAGKFLNASLEKASTDNERQVCVVENEQKDIIIFSQIAGLIARRIVCNLEEDQEVKAGERFGIIKFGSRMDIYMPLNADINVSLGQTMLGGETVIAKLATVKAGTKEVTKAISSTTSTKKAPAKTASTKKTLAKKATDKK